MAFRVTIFFLCVIATFQLSAQDEFMIYGRARLPHGQADSIFLTARSATDPEYEKDFYLTGNGEYRLFFKYGEEYSFEFQKEGYMPLHFGVSTIFPEGIDACCQTPLEMDLHMFEPGSEFDTLFTGTFYTISYDPKFDGYNHDVDIDFKVQTMLVEAEIAKQEAIQDVQRRLEVADSLAVERQYLNLINKGNLYFAAQDWGASKQMFLKALEVKPGRRYPKYKLEDIKTAVELFNKTSGTVAVDIDSVVAPEEIETVAPPRVFVYTPPSDEELDALFKKDLVAQIRKEEGSDSVANARIAFVSEVLDDAIELVAPKALPAPVETASITSFVPVVQPEAQEDPVIKVLPEPRIAEEAPAVVSHHNMYFNEKSYQDSLKAQYPQFKTVEIEELESKTITRIYINKDNRVTIFMEVAHNWGGIFYFIDRTPLVPENISKGFYESATRSVALEAIDDL